MWLGVVIILLAIVLDLQYPDTPRSFIFSVLLAIIESIGIAILVASIFSYASGTTQFVNKIRGLLEDIVVKRSFLGNIDPEGKKEALTSLIQPSASEKSKYPNIGDYYGYFISKTLEIGKKSVRSNYQITSRAFLDKVKNKIAVEGTYSYRLYPSNNGFQDITLGFEEEDNGDSICNYVAISTPDGERHVVDNIEMKPVNKGGDKSRMCTIPASEIGTGHDRLDIEIKLREYGSDHWALITFKALQPTDGFKFILHCEENLRITDHSIFVVGATYYVDIDEYNKNMTITCNQWINEGSGLSILVSIPHTEP